jgi:hypothetical protein
MHLFNRMKKLRRIGIDIMDYYLLLGYAVAHLVEALRYKPEGRRFDP